MFTVQKIKTRRAGGALWALWAAVAFCVGSAFESQAQPAPANDNLTKAQGILGISGSVHGTNLQATVQTKEPDPVPALAPLSTIWYVWTAPVTAEMDFNTRGSTDPDGLPLDTMLGVYSTNDPALPLTFANLTEIGGNEDDPSGGVTSRVDIPVTQGVTYWIQVGSVTNKGDGYGQGYTVLNWAPSLLGGGLGFSSSTYSFSSLENWLPDDLDPPTVTPSIYGLPNGGANARISVARFGGAVGRCEVTLSVTPGTYTNTYYTNYLITNVFITNYTTGAPFVAANEISYTNIFETNVSWVNWYTNFQDGAFEGLPAEGDELVVETNTGTKTTKLNVGPITNMFSLGLFGLPDFFTNFPCPLIVNPALQPVSTLTVSNSDGTWTVFTTNIFCPAQTSTTVVVPSAYGFYPAIQGDLTYTPFTNTLTLDDYQMSYDAYLQFFPLFLSPYVDGDYTPGPEDGPDFGLATAPDPDYFYYGLNSWVYVNLSDAVLDKQENPDIVAPTIIQPSAMVDIHNFQGNPNVVYSNDVILYGVTMSFERSDYRCNKLNAFVAVAVQQSVPYNSGTHTVEYTVDYDGETSLTDNQFATVADADYAQYNDNVYNIYYPYADYGYPAADMTWNGTYGTLTFPAFDQNAEGIFLPIYENDAVEFDEDIFLTLGQTAATEMANLTATPPAWVGAVDQAHLTINFDNITPSVEPGGAIERTYNVDGSPASYPPDNTLPGANSVVNAVVIDNNGLAVIGGDFDAYNSVPINYLARIQTNGLMDYTFTNGLGRGPNGFVNAIALDASGRIIIGGNFTSFNATNAFHIARLNFNGSLDTNFATSYGFNGNVYALAVDAAGNIIVGGDFTSFDFTNCNHIARLLPSGGLDTSFLPSSGIGITNGTDQDVHAVAVDSLGHVILGGNFTKVNGVNWNHIGRLLANGTVDSSFSPGFGADGNVLALAVQSDNSIILGGAFHNFNLLSRNSIARLTPSGALDASFGPGTGFDDIVYSLALQPWDGNILVGGQFTMYDGVRRVAMARLLGGQGVYAGEGGWLDTSYMDTSYNQFAGMINHYYNTNAYNTNDFPNTSNERRQVLAMGLQTDSNIVVGGSFFRLGGGTSRIDVHPRMNLARVIGAPTAGPLDTATGGGTIGGLGNYPGNVTFTQSPYSVDDFSTSLYITMSRVNGSLGPVQVTMETNLLPTSSSSATSADLGLAAPVGTFETVYALGGATDAPDTYGWRMMDGEYGTNLNIETVPDNGASALGLTINNDPSASPIIYADLSLLDVTATNLIYLGGVPIPMGPALGQYSSEVEIINDNFPAGTIGFSAASYSVLDTAGTLTITLLRTNGDYGSPSVTVNVSNETASLDTDFGSPQPTTVNFASGQTSATFSIPIVDFSTPQTNKYFVIYLSSPTAGASLDTNATPLVPSNAVVTIIDGHFQPGFLSFSAPTYSVLKPGTATISVTRSGAALGQLSVQCGTTNGTAINGVNYVGVTNTLTWGNQDISTKTITVQTLQDSTVEGNKTVNLFLTNAQVAGNSSPLTNAEVLASPSNAVLTIIDTDSYGNLNFQAPNFTVFQNGGQALITVTRTGGTVGNVSVNFTTYALTNVELPYQAAVAGSNYGTVSTNLSFGPGVSSQSFAVPIYQTSETSPADRLVGLRLFSGSPTNIASQFPQTAVLTILDPELHLNAAGSVDTTTQNGTGFDNTVNSLSLQPDASIVAGGEFAFFNGYPFPDIARLVPSGSFDTGFLLNMAGANNTVWQVLSQTPAPGQIDGNIMMVGDFTVVNSLNSPRIARLNLDGSLDTSFNPGSGADGTVFAIAQMTLPVSTSTTNLTNEIYYVIGGDFANYNGTPASGVARVTPAGLFDPNFNLGSGVTGGNTAVHAVAITANNEILLGGDFTSFDNQTHQHLVQLNVDGTLDTNFTAFDGVTTGINGSVRAIVVQPDGRILIGGLFTTVNGSNFNYIARLNSDGTTDTNFNIGVGCNNNVQTIVLDDQLRILVGGSFSQASGVTRNGITRLNPDGTVDPSINFGFGANGFVDAILVQTNDEIDVAGNFTTFDNIPENNFARLYGGANAGDGSIQFSFQTYGVLEGNTNAIIGLQRLGGTFGSPTVSAVFFTSNGTAISGVNYTGVTNTVSFPVGETFESVLVPITNNAAVGPDLTVNLMLTNPPSNTEEIGPQVDATLIITNVNAGIEFSATGYNQSSTAGSVAIPIVRVGNPNTTVSVNVYTGTNGTATPFTNYIPATNTLIFYPGQTTNYFLITILDSLTTYQDTTVDLELEDATNAIVASPSSATLNINSVLAGPGFLSFSQTNYFVTNGIDPSAIITVLRSNGNANQITVYLTTAGGTAIPGVNYSNASTTLTFAQDVNVATDSIPIIPMTNAAPNTTVILTLSSPGGNPAPSLSSPTQAVLTIVNDIAAFNFSSASYFVSQGAGSATLTILRVGPATGSATVNYTTYSPTNASETNGYAVPNVDYVPTSGTLTFPPGETLETIPVTILQTTNVNPVLSFQVLLQSPSAGTQLSTPSVATVGIISDVTGFSFTTNAYSVGENGSNIVIGVNRLNANTGALTVHFATSDNTALAGVDYVATNGTLNFLDGQTNTTVTVEILNPNLVESNKTFNIALSNPTTNSYLVSPYTAVVTITNVYVGLAFGSPSFTVSECATSAIIPVELTGLTNSTINVTYSTENGSGIAGTNYFPANGVLTFLPGQTVAYFDVMPIDNHVIGPDHTVQLNLTNNFPVPPGVGGVQLLNPSTALLTIQECNGAYIIKSGTAFVTGSIEPSTGVIYSNDTVTVLLGLRDIAGGNASNLIATLVLTNGITTNGIPNFVSSVNYGTLIQNGPTVSAPFTFTAVGSNGQNIVATLNLRDDANTNLGSVAFGFTIGGSTLSYTNAATIFLNENTNAPTIASNYPSLINISGVPGFITKATVTFSNFAHSFPSDVDAVLEGPTGSNSILMSHCGGSDPVGTVGGKDYGPPVTLTFDQTASAHVSSTKLTSGTYLPTAYSSSPYTQMPLLPPVPTNETVPVAPPESPYPYVANLSTFLGASPNGNWSLWAICDQTLDSGYISNGWILNISTGVAVENDSDLEVTVNPVPSQATTGNLLTYFLTVTNFGPSGATNVVITDYLPAGVVYLSNSCNCGTETNGILTVDLASLAVGAGTAFNISLMPTNLGYITNVVTALALEPDPNSNNMVTNINVVGPPSADMGITLTGIPNPALLGGGVLFSVALTNGGPSAASDVVATLTLPPGFVADTNGILASTGTATNVNGTITWTVGNLPFSLTAPSPTLTVATEALTAGIGLCSASVSSSVFDPLKGNNFSAVKIEVDQPMLSVSSAAPYLLTWSALATNYTLQGAINLPPPAATNLWINLPAPPIINGQYTFTLSGTNIYHFFRLSAQLP